MNYKFGEKVTGTIWLAGVIAIVFCADLNAGLYMSLSAFIFVLGDKLESKQAFKEAFITNLIGLVLLVLSIGLVITSKMI